MSTTNTPSSKLANETIASWVHLYTADLVNYARYKTGNLELSEDLVQDTFISAFKAFEKFENKSAPKTWLISILRNKITDHYRSQAKRFANDTKLSNEVFFNETGHWQGNQVPREWEEETHLLDNTDFIQTLSGCIEALPDHWKGIITMKYISNESGNFICEELKITPTNYWQIIHRSKLQLRKCIELNWFKA